MEDSNPQPALEEGPRLLPPGGKPWAVEVDVYLDSDTDPPKFRIKSTLPLDKTDPDDPLLIFENRGRPGFEIRFYLYDGTGKGYRFPLRADDAVWSVIAETGCPNSEAHEVFDPIRVTEPYPAGPAGTMLVVKNENAEKDGAPIGKFRYTLNVSTTGRGPYLPLDPGGVDQNGPRTFGFR